ncbi:membrane-spanning 4-domains subfamily A member 4A-like [Labeo rohita]|uniref:membrane-spanning 4-domains subfamily A member 4A-like n=1 Tax=Labeo rohita TaxID=84645 RepID=UPI0021E1CF19|nr:membrane-spanning 4-domains subfamily A member 4A-like [Labeo rohita]
MEITEVISTDRTAIVIQINPQAKDYADEQEARGTYHNSALKGFFKGQPKALGTVQIMIGVMVFSLGIVYNANINRMVTISLAAGINYWGSVIYISAGSLSVAAQNKLHPCVVKASLGMNVFSATTATIAILLMGLDFFNPLPPYHCSYHYYGDDDCVISKGFVLGIIILLLVFSSLQFIISICIAAFACKATSNNNSTVVSVELNQRY